MFPTKKLAQWGLDLAMAGILALGLGCKGSTTSSPHTPLAPTITTQPHTTTVLPPDPVTFNVVATADSGGTLTYVWKKNASVISGAITASYTVASTEFPTNTDAYSVTVSEGTLSTESATVYAIAAVPSPTYAGDPVTVPSRPLTVLPSTHVNVTGSERTLAARLTHASRTRKGAIPGTVAHG